MTRRAALNGVAAGLELALANLRKLIDDVDGSEWIDQRSSPIGRRAHLEAVRRGLLVGRKVAGRILVRRCELDEYIERYKVAPKKGGDESTNDLQEQAEIMAFTAPRRRKAG